MSQSPFESFDDEPLDDFGADLEASEGEPAADNNRTFMLVAGGMGALILLSLIFFAAYIFFIAPRQQAERAAQQATVAAQNTQIAAALTGTAEVLSWTATPLPSPVPTDTPVPSPTPVVVMPTDTPTPDTTYVTATIEAALTQAALAQLTVVPTSTALPNSGFADDVGLPGLLVMGLALVVVMFLARKLRTAPVAR